MSATKPIRIIWHPQPAQRNLGRGQIPPIRRATVTSLGTEVGMIREMYGSRFGRDYDAFNLAGECVAAGKTLDGALVALGLKPEDYR